MRYGTAVEFQALAIGRSATSARATPKADEGSEADVVVAFDQHVGRGAAVVIGGWCRGRGVVVAGDSDMRGSRMGGTCGGR